MRKGKRWEWRQGREESCWPVYRYRQGSTIHYLLFSVPGLCVAIKYHWLLQIIYWNWISAEDEWNRLSYQIVSVESIRWFIGTLSEQTYGLGGKMDTLDTVHMAFITTWQLFLFIFLISLLIFLFDVWGWNSKHRFLELSYFAWRIPPMSLPLQQEEEITKALIRCLISVSGILAESE